ncbi:hypothetical protein KI387_001062, partial [Taxus chinensis]
MLRYVHGTVDIGLEFKKNAELSTSYSDVDFGRSIDDKIYTIGYDIFLGCSSDVIGKWKQVRCIVFVRRVIAAMVIGSLLRCLDCFTGLKTEYIVGSQVKLKTQTGRQQAEIVEAFREGKVNIIVATQVLEEGFDIKECNLVIRFDFSDTVCSFIQSRGRARMQGSHYVLLVKRGDASQEKQIDNFLESEKIMRDVALNRTLKPPELHVNPIPSTEIYCVSSTDAIVSLNSSVALIHYYCSQLPGDRYYTPRPIFHINKEIGECVMELPRNCPILSVKVQGKCCLLKNLACLEACKKLHAVGALTHYMLPAMEEVEQDESGTEKTRQLGLKFSDIQNCKVPQPLYVPNDLVGDWDPNMAKILFHCYYLSFERNFRYNFPFCGVLLLLKHKLDSNVESMLLHLETTSGGVTVQSAYAGSLQLTSSEVEIARKFQVTVFGLLLGHNLDTVKGGILKTVKANMMYLLLPLVNISSKELASSIDWTCIRNASFSESQSHETSCIRDIKLANMFQTSCGSLPVEMLQNSIIVTPHTGRLYYVTDVLQALNANSRIKSEKVRFRTDQMKTYVQHFKDRYGIHIKYPWQPLLCARPLFRVQNLLLRRPQAETVSITNSTVQLPPELCKPIFFGIPIGILYTFSFLPSVMHRIEGILIAAHFQKRFSSQCPYNFNISVFKVLEALTRKKCQECMSLESLETLGDAFLKYVSSRHVFTTYSEKHEGQLTSKRAQIISNYGLFKMGCNRKLPGYIRNEHFDPQQWIIPGQDLPSLTGFPQEKSYSTENLYIKDTRLMKIKNIADVVEALIGAFLDCGGEILALNFIKWIGINIDLPQETSITKMLDTRLQSSVNIPFMESLLQYSFHNPVLLVEALTHASYQVPWVSGCYQRLEFLGDAVMDYLITLYMYKTYPGLSPGELTDLKSAAVNNDCYAQAAVKWNLQRQVLHASSVLQRNITDFVQLISSSSNSRSHSYGWCTTESAVPK